jgi:hypothetical protein
VARIFHDINGLKIIERCRAAIPRRIGALSGNIVAMARRNRNGCDHLEFERGGIPSEIGRDLVEASLVEAGQVDLVDGTFHQLFPE